MKNNKAATDIPAEFLKTVCESPQYIDSIRVIFEEIWSDIVIPEVWRKTTITGLYKNKGNRKGQKNYRGLSIGSTFLKLAMSIILERIKPWYNQQLLPDQFGFRQFYACPDAIFSLKSIQNTSSRLSQEICLLFDDLTAAYDWCVRSWLFNTIFNRIEPDNQYIYNCVRIME